MKIKIKPLSVNECWAGRRFKTPKYKQYEEELLWKLKDYEIPLGKIEIVFEFGFSNKMSDWDNPIKPLQDILQKRYGFNDRDVYKAIVRKELVDKGEEYIKFEITKYERN